MRISTQKAVGAALIGLYLAVPAVSAAENACPSDTSTATNQTFHCLKNLPAYSALPALPTFYFSSEDGANDFLPQGDDSNPCTLEAPCRTVEKMGAIAAGGQVHLIVDVDTWDDFEDFDPDGELNGEYGIGYSFFDNPNPCGASGDDACVIVSGMDFTGARRPTFDCSTPAEPTRGLGDGVARNNAKYPDPPKLNSSGAFFFAGTGPGVTEDVGWLAIENVIVKNCPEWSTTGPYNPASVTVYGKGKVSLLNTDVIDHVGKANVGGIWGSDGNTGRILLINVNSSSIDFARFDQDCVGDDCADPDALCDGSAGSPWHFCKAGGEATGHLENFWDKGVAASILIGGSYFQENTQYDQSSGIVNGKHHLGLYGSEIFLSPNARQKGTIPNFHGLRAINFENETGGCHADICDLHVVDTSIFGLALPCTDGCAGGGSYAHGGIGILFNEDSLARSDVGRYRLFRTTLSDTATGILQGNSDIANSGDPSNGPIMDLWGACLIIDEILQDQFGTSAWQWRHANWTTGSSVHVIDSILDEDDTGSAINHFHIDGSFHTTRASAQAAYATLPGTVSWFEDAASFDSGGPGVDGNALGAPNPCETHYADLFVNGGDGTGGYVPAYVMGQKLVGFSLEPQINVVPLRFGWLLATLLLLAGTLAITSSFTSRRGRQRNAV
jgi:hypothetical protein